MAGESPSGARRRIGAILEKELRELRKNKLIVASMAALPLIFTAIIIVLNVLVGRASSGSLRGFTVPPELAAFEPGRAFRILLNDQLMFYQLLVPMILPTVVAAHSVIGEKQARTLEPLLATPVRTWELLAAKVLAAVLPVIAIGWLSYGVVVAGVRIAAGGELAGFLLRPLWLIAMLGAVPLLALFSAAGSVCVSTRVNDVRTAQAVAGVGVLPLIGAGMVVLVGQQFLTALSALAVCAALVPIDLALLALATKIFQREAILTRWR
jgi:ABC-2 type transport system permease protein